MRVCGWMGTVLIAWYAWGTAPLCADGTAELLLAEAPDRLFEQESPPDADPVLPGVGQVVVVGLVDYPDFAVSDPAHLAVLMPDGRQLPLLIEGEGLVSEFGEIIALRCAFMASAESAGDGFRLVWGPEIAAANSTVPRLVLDPSRRRDYRQFSRKPKPADPGAESSVATVEVIADSTAEYHFLWYLLPMAVIFTLLTVRKIHARHADNRTGS